CFIAGLFATKKPLDTNHAPTLTLLFTRNVARAQSGHSASPRTARNAAPALKPRRHNTTNASPIAAATIGNASYRVRTAAMHAQPGPIDALRRPAPPLDGGAVSPKPLSEARGEGGPSDVRITHTPMSATARNVVPNSNGSVIG